MNKSSSCNGCDSSHSCGIAALGKILGKKNIAPDPDSVPDEVFATKVISAAVLAYMFPLVGFILFAVGGNFIANLLSFENEWFVVLSAVGGLFGGGLAAKFFFNGDSGKPRGFFNH